MGNSEDRVHHNSMSKIDRYGWIVHDTPGVFLEIDKHDLNVDKTYQRDQNEAKVKAIASAWSWVSCAAIVVADRSGLFFVMDGQHRVLAARRRSDITTLPCLVFSVEQSADEAKGFLRINKGRRPLTSIETFKAECSVGNTDAIEAQRIMTASGRYASQKDGPNTVRCIAMLTKIIREQPGSAETIYDITNAICHGRTLNNRVLAGIATIVRRMKGESKDLVRLRRRLVDVGYDEIDLSISKACSFFARGGDKVFAEGILQAANKGLRNRFEVEGLGS